MSLKQQAELNNLKRRADEQDDVIAAIWARLEELEQKNNTEKRGRPKKVANG